MNCLQPAGRPLDAVATALMVVLCLSWGLNQVAIKLALPEIPPMTQKGRSARSALCRWCYIIARFMVFATQNPVDYEGTFPLPESQMDRFLMRLQMGYPEFGDELAILQSATTRRSYDLLELEPVATRAEVLEIQHYAPQVYVEDSVLEYILKIVTATRTETEFQAGISTRGSLALKLAAQAAALADGRAFVVPADVMQVVKPVCVHRLGLRRAATDSLEAEMKKEIKANNTFEKIVVTREQAIKDAESGRLGGLGERPGNPSKFKIGNLRTIPEGEQITYYKNGDFMDLCAGPHVMRTGNIGAFKLTHVASAYYKGDEKNPQLPAHLRHGVQEQDGDGGVFHDAGGGQAPGPSEDRRGDGIVRD